MKGKALGHLVRYFFGIDKAHTQTSIAEMSVIRKYAANKKYCVEIGVYEAVNTVSIAKTISDDAVFYAIDPFFKGLLGICYYKWITKLNLTRNKVSGKVRLVEKFSHDASRVIENKVDFIFIDGDHSFSGIESDWKIYSEKVVTGGHILLHDTAIPDFDPDRAHLDSIPYFNEIIRLDNRFCVVETVDSLNVLKKLASHEFMKRDDIAPE